MILMTIEDYKNSYIRSNYKYLPDGQYCNPLKKLNDNQLNTKYEKYLKKANCKDIKGNSKYVQEVFDVEKECREEDPRASTFYLGVRLYDEAHSTNFEDYFKKMNKMLGDIYDPAHIFPRGSNHRMAVMKENIIMMPRFVHSLLDSQLEIFDFEYKHHTITKERHDALWIIIVGEDRMNLLKEIKRECLYG